MAEQPDEGVHGKLRDAPKARRATKGGPGRYGPGQRMVDGASFSLADEVRYIVRRAADHDGRVVTLDQLTLFSSETSDAWLIERDDHLALQLARDSDAEPFHIEETETSFTIDWKGHYRIEGAAFVYTERHRPHHSHPRLSNRIARTA
jgi:hypothetical protein